MQHLIASWRRLTARADGIPLRPGETSIPPGTVRAYHFTAIENAEAIRREGLRFDRSRGQSYGEGNGLWFDAGYTSWGSIEDPGKALVEVALPQDTPIINGGFSSTFVIAQDVPPSQIVAIHEAWHEKVRYFVENGVVDEVKAGDFDHVADHLDYGPAIEYLKRHGVRTTASRDLPARPGTQPVPPGHVRAFTRVGAIGGGASAEVIARDGLRVDKATVYQDQFGSFQELWFITGAPDLTTIQNSAVVVEAALPAVEGYQPRDGETVTLGVDVPPSQFLGVYEPWMGYVWEIIDIGDVQRTKDMDDWELSTGDPDADRALRYVRERL